MVTIAQEILQCGLHFVEAPRVLGCGDLEYGLWTDSLASVCPCLTLDMQSVAQFLQPESRKKSSAHLMEVDSKDELGSCEWLEKCHWA